MSNIALKLLKLVSLKKTVFSTNELAMAWGIDSKNVLRVVIARAVRDGYLLALRRGLYALPDVEVDVFELACKMKKLSYVSFETVLANAGVIHQWYDEVYLASNRSSEVANDSGKFHYRDMPVDILLNNAGVINKGNYFIATPERALCDKIYKDGVSYFDDLSVLDRGSILEISKIYNKRVMDDVAGLFYEDK